MKKKVIFLTFIGLCIIGHDYAQTTLFDDNHQLLQIQRLNGSFTTYQYDANGNRISHFSTSGPVPIKLLSFNAQKSTNKVLLTWSTSLEVNSDRFEIEFSKNGQEFITFTTVAAKGNSSIKTDYTSLHCCPVEGINYYRLKSFDRNGRFEYSDIRTVEFRFENVMTVYPNPTTERSLLNISFTKALKLDAAIAIYTVSGAVVYKGVFPKNIAVSQVNTKGLAAGSYFVVVTSEGVDYKSNFVKH